ncbi:MAG TPA: tRNA pseudouridine(38-40) synthase TruA [Balneolales bacterium]|nr:tRNA pseudouridine(38-40) synthase TruA [Balneolales bacterium]
MSRYQLFIEYDGTHYAGWQTQPDEPTIQDAIEAALAQILRKEISIVGAGRTDSGVHAEGQVAHFDFEEPIDKKKLLKSLWGVLPRDIAVWDMKEVDGTFHARFDGTARQYRYQIIMRPSPLHRPLSWERYFEFDISSMIECAKHVNGVHDFESFCKHNPDVNHTRCEVTHSEISFKNDLMIVYRIKANRFLHHMVRSLVGTMVEVGLGKRSTESFKTLVLQPDRTSVGVTAPAQGLILEKVFYKK